MNEAVRQLEKAVELDPNHAAALTNLGLAVSATGRPAAAIPYLQRAVRLNPSDPLSRFGLASAYQAVGDAPAAREHAQLLQRLDPRLARQLHSWSPGDPVAVPPRTIRSSDANADRGARP
jgi:tetratricopeptide (TPR) repeat protein